jgi:hypothetical protein
MHHFTKPILFGLCIAAAIGCKTIRPREARTKTKEPSIAQASIEARIVEPDVKVAAHEEVGAEVISDKWQKSSSDSSDAWSMGTSPPTRPASGKAAGKPC